MTFSQKEEQKKFLQLQESVAARLSQSSHVGLDPLDAVLKARTYTELRTAISVVLAELNMAKPWAGKYNLMGMLASDERKTSQMLDELELAALGVEPSIS